MKEQAAVPDLFTSHCESYRSIWPYKNTNQRNASLLCMLGIEPMFLLPSGLRRTKKHTKIKWLLFIFSPLCPVNAAGINLVDALLDWQGGPAQLRTAGEEQVTASFGRHLRQRTLAFPGKHFFLTGRTPHCYSNKHSIAVMQAFESQVLSSQQGKNIGIPCPSSNYIWHLFKNFFIKCLWWTRHVTKTSITVPEGLKV